MKNLFLKVYPFILLILLMQVGSTNSYFNDSKNVGTNSVSAGCWDSPSLPVLIYPTNGYVVVKDSEWDLNPHMDWADSMSCDGGNITYQYESYIDPGLTSLAYRSGWLTTSMINAQNTPNGSYYWRVRSNDGVDISGWSNAWLLVVNRVEPTRSIALFEEDSKSDIETQELVVAEALKVSETPTPTPTPTLIQNPTPIPTPTETLTPTPTPEPEEVVAEPDISQVPEEVPPTVEPTLVVEPNEE